MISEYQIKARYNNARNTANELTAIANKLTYAAHSDLGGALRVLENTWQGENAERFVRKGNILKEQIEETARDIRRAAETLQTDAKSRYRSDMNQLEAERAKAKEDLERASEVIQSSP